MTNKNLTTTAENIQPKKTHRILRKMYILVEKDSPIEITMSDVDDVLMDIRESIFNHLNEKDVCVISIATDFEFVHIQKEMTESKMLKKK